MGVREQAGIDSWLHDGGLVITASDRAARAISAAFNHRRREEGLAAWPVPSIQDWRRFAIAAWEERALDGRMLLNPAQEQALWADIIGKESHVVSLLEGPRQRMARMAMDAHELLCSYAPRYLKQSERSAWSQDAEAFSNWLASFDEGCRTHKVVSAPRAVLELTSQWSADSILRRPLLAVGFDRVLPAQRALFDAWGPWQEMAINSPAQEVHFYAARDSKAELDACAQWSAQQLKADPQARLLVITQDISTRRGEIERAFLQHGEPGAAPLFEFSLGVPLSQNEVARGASLLMQWLDGALAENELDWLFSTALAACGAEETVALQAHMRALRHRGLQRTQWTLEAFVQQRAEKQPLPPAWLERVTQARQRLLGFKTRQQSPMEWAGLVPQLLQVLGLPGNRAFSSADYQAFRRWGQAVDTCGSLGFDGRRIAWGDFLTMLGRTLDETLFAPESSDAPIQIAGPAESAGLTADAIWFLGADEDAWPSAGSSHPLLPLHVRRQAGMPHATPRYDWELAQAITTRLLSSAPAIHFSYAEQKDEAETRPSRLITQLAGHAQPLPDVFVSSRHQPQLTITFEDTSRIPFSPHEVRGGSSVLTAQSQCPFKAFATARLGAQAWEPAEAGLTALQRGQLLHEVLHRIWDDTSPGIRTQEELKNHPDLNAFVADCVRLALRKAMPAGARERMPQRYLELEALRLAQLATEWLQFELTRAEFTVDETEVEHPINLEGLALQLRLDRIDRLKDGSLLVIDYKTGEVTPRAWDLPRPDDVQLPLYAGFAVEGEVGGLVFAKVRTRDVGFSGYVRDARATLSNSLNGNHSLMKNKLTSQQLTEWRHAIQQLARDFLAGRAELDPRDYPRTCERCGLQTLCRVQEEQNRVRVETWTADEAESNGASDE